MKGIVAKGTEPKPDIEDAYEQDEEMADEDEVKDEDDEDGDITKVSGR